MSVPGTQLSPPPEAALQTYPFALADLPYAYDALEPHIDQKSMQLHHRGHHAAYVKKLNEAVAKRPELQSLTLSELLASPARVPAAARAAIKDNGGGHLNHDLFWSVLAPPRSQAPQGALARAIDADFGSDGAIRRRRGRDACGSSARRAIAAAGAVGRRAWFPPGRGGPWPGAAGAANSKSST